MFRAFIAISLMIQASTGAERFDDPQYNNNVLWGSTKMVCGVFLVAANATFFGLNLKEQLEINHSAAALRAAGRNETFYEHSSEILTVSEASAFMPALGRSSAIAWGPIGMIHGGWMAIQGAKQFPFREALERFKQWFRASNQAGNTEEDPLIVESVE